ncbi:low-density lipoprotein receptor-related protein 2-like isoform X1 [Dermacentor andersoni]|uniref:low-density lipoprotein receptor-related protein 2-like isoform X1 n=1 Tax=Dermacentor andersoni TaxID=34620 RepID=UPI0021551C99|nr:prolow-density lipoprotein receptor-related protein 1-like isoform X1 [Dermacentor andersoni]
MPSACFFARLLPSLFAFALNLAESLQANNGESPCNEWGRCAQTCIQNWKNQSLVECGCVEGFRLDINRVSCLPVDPLASYLLITTSVGIQQSFVESKGESHFLYNSNTLAVALDFLLSGPKTTVFWSDINTDQINAGEVVEGRLKDVRSLVTGGLESVEGLAVDWIACNLYWVESRHQEIEVSRCDGSMRASVVGDVRRPRGLALDPRVGFLFWTDWNDENPRIERSYLDGSSRKVIVNVEEYSNLPKSLPNGITLDYAVNRVYWIDARSGSIHTVKYDGTGHKKILHLSTFSKPFSMDVFGDYFYWTDITFSSIFKAHRFSLNASQKVVVQSSNTLYQAIIVHPSRHPTYNTTNYCAYKNGFCSHLCVLGNGQPLCMCPYGLQLGPDKRTCEDHGPLVLYQTKNTNIVYFALASDPSRWIYPPVKLHATAFALTYDSQNEILYWIEGRTIKRHMLKTYTTEIFAEFGSLVKLTALSLDCLSGNLYVGNSVQLNSEIRSQISVCATGGRYCSNLIWDSVRHVSGLAVDAANRLVLWMERERSSADQDLMTVKAAHLNGSVTWALHTWTCPKNAAMKGFDVNPLREEVCWSDINRGAVMCISYGTSANFSEVFLARGGSQDHLVFTADGEKLLYSPGNGSLYSIIYGSHNAPYLVWNSTQPLSYLKHTSADDILEHSASRHPCHHLPVPCNGICLPEENGHRCLPIGGSDTLLVFLQNHRTVVYPVGSDATVPPLLLQAEFSEMPLDSIHVLSTEEAVVFSSRERLYWARIDGYNVTPVATLNNTRVTALAADASSGLLYRAVFSSHGARIESFFLNGTGVSVLVDTDLHRVNALAIHPSRRLLFWSDAGEWPRIERFDLETKERQTIVHEELFQVSDLTLDLEHDLVYWCDLGTARIERARLDGTRRTSIVLNKGPNRHYSPVSVAVFQSVLFWIDSTYSGGSLVMLVKNRHPQISTWSRFLGPNMSHLQLYNRHILPYLNESSDMYSSNLNPIMSCRGFCFNGGTCSAIDDGPGGPTCQCTANFTGPRCQFYAAYIYNPPFSDEEPADVKIIVIPVAVLLSAFLLMLVVAWVKRRRAWQSTAVSLSSEEANPALAARMIDSQYETSFSDNVLLMGTNLAFEDTEPEPRPGNGNMLIGLESLPRKPLTTILKSTWLHPV